MPAEHEERAAPAAGTRHPPSVCVIIAAYNAERTIGRAVASALAEPEVAQVVVIDDASSDATSAVAAAHADGSDRLLVRRLADNAGPSHARNIAIGMGSAPLIAILDADDFFLPGRFAALLATPDWDLVADNIAFVDEARVDAVDVTRIAAHRIEPRSLTAGEFIQGCISRSDRYKGELGFLKPVLSRAFLDQHRLRYAEELRLAEDFDLYARALMAGARFQIAGSCHYVAVERRGSLSSAHGLAELERFEAAVERLLAAAPHDAPFRPQLQAHMAQTARKRRHRAVLARKRAVGAWRALREEAANLRQLVEVLTDIAGDKLRTARAAITPPAPTSAQHIERFLL
jgi:succinoglycan biosynthesis protein ExoU